MCRDPEVDGDFKDERPPRHLPEGALRHIATSVRLLFSWGGTALFTFGSFYSVIFFALKAPTPIRIGFAIPVVLGIGLFAIWGVGVLEIKRLIVSGRAVEGELVSMVKPRESAVSARTSVPVRYRFLDGLGRSREGRRIVRWREEYRNMQPGDSISLFYDPDRPSSSVPLFIIL